ncbi:MAG TPA: hypothetical protein VK472_05480 [Allosphingosinicella sp.]|nr:hypothetical protein [Allosphingosinicella sp.]
MHIWATPGFAQLGAAALVAAVLGYALSWLIDRIFFRRFTSDRVGGIALSSAASFLILMGGATLFLTWTSPFVNGPIIIPPLGYAIAFLVGVALAGARRMVEYGRAYARNDDQESFEPDWNDLSLYDDELTAFDAKYGSRNYLLRHWAGHLSLPLSYWINGALLSVAVAAAAEYLSRKAEEDWGSLRLLAMVGLGYFAVAALVWIWSSVGIWRSAYWHRRRGGSAGWGFAARALIIVGTVATLFRSGDLALQAAEFGTLAAGRDSIGAIADMKVEGSELFLSGNIAAGAADRFDSLLEANPGVKGVVLTSTGGRMLESGRMAATIRKHGLDTRVDDHCMSACTDLLVAGRARTAPNRARIGFHQPDFPGISASEREAGIEKWRQRYLDAGVEWGFVWRAMATPASGMWFPTADELVAANVLTSPDIVVTRSGGGGHAARPESLSDQRLKADLAAEAARTNKRTPIRLDPQVTLDRAQADGFTLTNFYTVKMANIDIATSRRAVSSSLRQEVCGTPQSQSAVRDGARFVFIYRNPAGRKLFDVSVTECRV